MDNQIKKDRRNSTAMYALLEQEGVAPWVLQMPESLDFTDDQFFEFCVLNRELLRIERTAEGEILIMSPTGAKGSHRNLEISTQLAYWAKRDGTGSIGRASQPSNSTGLPA